MNALSEITLVHDQPDAKPMMRELCHLVTWSQQVFTDVDRSSLEWRSLALDDVVGKFSPWVQQLYILRAKGVARNEQLEFEEVARHLMPLYYLLQLSTASKVVLGAIDMVAAAVAQEGLDVQLAERCRMSLPMIMEVISTVDRLNSGTQDLALRQMSKHRPCGFSLAPREERRARLHQIVQATRQVLEDPATCRILSVNSCCKESETDKDEQSTQASEGDRDEIALSLARLCPEAAAAGSLPEGYTLLHFLCEHTHDTHLIRLAASISGDLDARDDKGHRPLDYALQNPHADVAQCLLELIRDGTASSHHSHHTGGVLGHDRPSNFNSLEEPAAHCGVLAPLEAPQLQQVISPNGQVVQPLSEPLAVDTPPEQTKETTTRDAAVKGPPRDANLGNMFMLRTQLATATRENDQLREKASEIEMLRTRVAILADENNALRDTSATQSSSSSTHQRQPSPQCVLPVLPTLVETDHRLRESAPDLTPKVLWSSAPAALLSTPSRPTAAGSFKSSPSVGNATAETASVDNGGLPPSDSPKSVVPPLKGKGKGKTKGCPKLTDNSNTLTIAEGKGKGKGKASASEPTKPTLAPTTDLKSVNWTRFVNGAQIEEGTTIWDTVNKIYDAQKYMDFVPVDEIEQRFSKNASVAAKPEKERRKDSDTKKAKITKLDSISQDQRFQIEVSLRTLPLSVNTGSKALLAITNLNRSLLSAEAVSTLQRFLCPTKEQEQQLRTTRQLGEQEAEKALEECMAEDARPDPFVWHPVEQFMEDLSQLPACSMRLSCWSFLYNLPERVNHLQQNLDRFEQMVHCFTTSQELPSLLGLVLAFGNYLNGGKNEKRLGQADGFHVEMLGRPGGLDVLNDSQGRNVRQLIFKVFFTEFQETAERLLLELSPMFALVQRRLGKDSDGAPELKKTVRVQIEELDKQLVQLKREFSKKQQELTQGLPLITDPADKFASEIPADFEHERKRVDELVARKDLVLKQFKALIANYKAETYRGDPVTENGRVKDGNPKEPMTSEVWCKIWDDFFVVTSLILSFDEKKQKEIMEPRFCKEDSQITVESLKVMWRLQDPKPTNTKKKAVASRGLAEKRHSCVF